MDADSKDRISACVRVLLDPRVRAQCSPLLLGGTRAVFSSLVAHKRLEAEKSKAELRSQIKTNPSDCISFRQLRGRNALGACEEVDDEQQLAQATSAGGASGQNERKFISRTNHRVNVFTSVSPRAPSADGDAAAGGKQVEMGDKKNIQALTGSTDPVYVEATVVVHDFDIVIDFYVLNRTDVTLTNVEVELFIVGDLKLTDRHPTFTLAPRAATSLVTNIKVSSTETGHVFGNVSFDVPNSQVGIIPTLVSLQEIYIDIMNYIRPATCSDAEFRAMWAEFEWENKVAVFTVIPDCRLFLAHIQTLTNMTCLTPQTDVEQDFLAANLFANSVFGEAALLNLSIEKSGGKIEGFIRIRAKNQGIALSLGDRITMKQKGSEHAGKQ
jgi:coatomer subunit beta